jgi:hypothetical protein
VVGGEGRGEGAREQRIGSDKSASHEVGGDDEEMSAGRTCCVVLSLLHLAPISRGKVFQGPTRPPCWNLLD